jgi:hypothetical protein
MSLTTVAPPVPQLWRYCGTGGYRFLVGQIASQFKVPGTCTVDVSISQNRVFAPVKAPSGVQKCPAPDFDKALGKRQKLLTLVVNWGIIKW